ncbi:hypothetical protein ACFLSP_04305 [Bacteroidota bacterium]
MKRILKYGLVLIGISLAGACEEYIGPEVNCDDCFYEKPDSADLVIHLTINDNHPEVPIVLYRGNVEDKQVDWVDTARETPFYIYSKVGQLYSVAAEYKVDGKKIIAIDGDGMKAKHVSDACDYSCWVVTGGYLKVELKFD